MGFIELGCSLLVRWYYRLSSGHVTRPRRA